MAEMLYRLGRFSARRAFLVIALWAVILGLAVGGFLVGNGPLASGFSIPGTETIRVTDELKAKIPSLSGGSGRVILTTENGAPFTEAQKSSIVALAKSAQGLPDVAAVIDPFATEQQRAGQQKQVSDGLAQVAAGRAQLEAAKAAGAQQAQRMTPGQLAAAQKQLAAQETKLADSEKQLQVGAELLRIASGIRTVSADGSTAVVNVSFTKDQLTLSDESKTAVLDHFRAAPIDGVEMSFSSDIAQTVPKIIGPGEVVGVVIAGLVLIIMLGTLIAAGLPILTALIGVGIGALATMGLSSVVDMSSVTPVLGVMLGLAVGIDYSLFIINRHRKQLARGIEVHESIGLANGTAGNAVVFAGTTVLVALVALNITGVPFLGLMGTVGAVCVAIAVLVAVTLTPALLGLVGARVLSRKARARTEKEAPPQRELKPMSTARAVFTVLAGAAVLLTLAIPAMSLRLSLPIGSGEATDSTQYQAYKTVEREFGAGANATLLVTATLPAGLDEAGATAAQFTVVKMLAAEKDVVSVAPIAVSPDRRLAAFQVIPPEGPAAQSTSDVVQRLRDMRYEGNRLGVAGASAANIDVSGKLADVLPVYIALVVGLSLIIMIVVFRSFLVPLIATAGFVLSLLATYGALVAIYQWGWLAPVFGVHDPGPILNFLPVILVGILFGLAMDYQLFLVSGMREAYAHGTPARHAVVWGLRAGRAVVIAAAIIMIAVFSGFIFAESVIIRPVGFGLAFGVLVDAFVVRMLLVPALMHLFGEAAWWFPRWLDRIVPNVDVEGASLERHHDFHPATEPSPEPSPVAS